MQLIPGIVFPKTSQMIRYGKALKLKPLTLGV